VWTNELDKSSVRLGPAPGYFESDNYHSVCILGGGGRFLEKVNDYQETIVSCT